MVWSESLRSRLLERWRVAPERVTACPPGVDLERFRPAADRAALRERFGAGPGELLLLFVGHNFVLKGLATVLEALRKAGEAGIACRLLVAGGGHVLPFRRRAAGLSIGDRVKFLGAVDRGELPALYTAADALLHPTFYDPFSLVALEALACGCPVITTRANGASQLIEAGRQGFLLDDPRDAGGIVRALETLRAALPGEAMRREAVDLARRHPFETHARDVIEWLRP
jgi:UDP-glucose:(heptosyl)LPS alpha-1,3-glucosyltransferase